MDQLIASECKTDKMASDDTKNKQIVKSVGQGNKSKQRDTENESEKSNYPAVVIGEDNTTTFAAASVNEQLTCKLCFGYFREPYTITECLHTFCKSCLFMAMYSGMYSCPICNVSLRHSKILFDSTKHNIINKIFPNLEADDERLEQDFYERRGIKRKDSHVKNEAGKQKSLNILYNHDDPIDVVLKASIEKESKTLLPSLEKPYLRAPGKMKIIQVKKFLRVKLGNQCPSDLSFIEVLCNETPVGEELSLNFIKRTRWDESLGDLVLVYKLNEDYLF